MRNGSRGNKTEETFKQFHKIDQKVDIIKMFLKIFQKTN